MGCRVVFCFVSILFCVVASAAPIRRDLEREAKPETPELVILTITDEILTDLEIEEAEAQKSFKIDGRDADADRVLDVLARMKGGVPVILGAAGVGKTTTVIRAAQKVVRNEYPQERPFRKALKDSVWISTTAGRLMKLVKSNNPAGRMAAIDDLFGAILKLQEKYQRNFILYIDEIHSLDEDQIEAMLPYLDSNRRTVRLIGSTNSDKFQKTFKSNDSWMRRIQPVGLEELSEAQTKDALKEFWVVEVQKNYGVRFTEHALDAVMRVSPTLSPEAGRFTAAINALQGAAIAQLRRKAAGEELARGDRDRLIIEDVDIYKYFTGITRYPVNPFDGAAMAAYMGGLKEKITQDIIDQPRMLDDVLGLFQSVMIGSKKGLGVAILVGPTGTGKSELGKSIAEHAFHNPAAFLRIDANEYKTGQHSMSKLFGAEDGLVGSNKRSGILCDYFDDPSAGKYGGVILIDEGERAHPDFWERLMEFLDNGNFVGGDGKRRFARKHIVIITSNRGDRILFPERANTWSTREIQQRVQEITPKFLKDLFIRKVSGKDDFSLPVPVLNRADLYTVSSPLNQDSCVRIVHKEAEEFKADTERTFHITMSIDPELLTHLTLLDYNLRDGARPIINRTRQILQQVRTDALAKMTLERDSHLRLSLDYADRESVVRVLAEDGEPITIPLPRKKSKDPLGDPDLRDRLNRLPETLTSRIVGQEQVIRSVVRAVIAHYGSPMASKRPLSFFLIGLTGTGKTELGKALAGALYDSPERAEVITLGNITHDSQFTKIFGSDPGYIGSDRERTFEDALRNNPNGGVIIWDEASNMGGQDKGLKNALFKKFYDLLDEGNWTSSATGNTYDLSKYTFIFTGNDGENLFLGASEDVIRLQTWERNNSRDKVRALLLEVGVPQAFVGRMADTLLMKPLLRDEVEAVAKGRLEPVLESFRSRGVEVEFEDRFLSQFSKSFFTQDTGGRSLRSVSEDRVRGLMTEALMKIGFQPEENRVCRLLLGLEDTELTRPYRLSTDPERAVDLKIQASLDGAEDVTVHESLVEYADKNRRMPIRQAIMVAYHEAGHAVLNDPNKTGERLRHLTIVAGAGRLGFASYDRREHQELITDHATVVQRMARLIAGQASVVLAGFPPNGGWGSDLEHMRSIATRYVLDWGMVRELEGVAVGEKGELHATDRQKDTAVREIDQLIDEARRLAIRTLTDQWPLVREVVRRLLKQGSIGQEEYEEMVTDFRTRNRFKAGRPNARRSQSCARWLLTAEHGENLGDNNEAHQ
ncbi:MAG: AAA family ATPase [Deltaproteobacteria bacterium]|nr:AAA family ATPase [Deltaproteobacteria bacterium]MBI3295292.1 AAA family ATPase [Deltaproteobacteria bacterium]